MIYQLAECIQFWYNSIERNIMPITEIICRSCNEIFKTSRANHKGRNPTFCSNSCRIWIGDKNDPRLKWRQGKGFWQIASPEQKNEKMKQLYEKNVIKKDGCWGWKAKLLENGYAKIGVGNRKIISAHRLSWLIHFGSYDKNLQVLHKCDNRACSNPSHLFLGNHDENMKDMVSKNRQMKGSRHYCVKLNEEKVREIRKLFKLNYKSFDIAKKFNVNSGTIQNIRVGRTWKHIKDCDGNI